MVLHDKGDPDEAMRTFRTLKMENQSELLGWIGIHLWHFIDPEWMLKQNWDGIDAAKIFFLRLFTGPEPFTPLVATTIAAVQEDATDRQAIGLFHLSDDEFIRQAKENESAPADILKDMAQFTDMREPLRQAWRQAGFIQ